MSNTSKHILNPSPTMRLLLRKANIDALAHQNLTRQIESAEARMRESHAAVQNYVAYLDERLESKRKG